MKWISIKDALPEKDQLVLFCHSERNDKYRCFAAFLSKENERFIIKGPSDFDIYINLENITHWMPLPEPPNTLPSEEKAD